MSFTMQDGHFPVSEIALVLSVTSIVFMSRMAGVEVKICETRAIRLSKFRDMEKTKRAKFIDFPSLHTRVIL